MLISKLSFKSFTETSLPEDGVNFHWDKSKFSAGVLLGSKLPGVTGSTGSIGSIGSIGSTTSTSPSVLNSNQLMFQLLDVATIVIVWLP